MQTTTRTFASSIYGVQVPRLIYGTAWKKERTAALVEQAVQLGFRGIDTACHPKQYHEAGVGEGLAATFRTLSGRDSLYLQTKFTPPVAQDPANIPYDPQASVEEQVAQSFRASLRNLQTTYLDCLIMHSPVRYVGGMEATWAAMETLVNAGGVRQLGISNCHDLPIFETLFNTSRIKPAVLQNRFYTGTNHDRELRDYCQANGVLYQSFWTLTANPQVLTHAAVRALATRYRRTPEQILFRYLTQVDVIPLTGTSNGAHMREDVDIFDFELTTPEVDSLRGLC